MKTIINVLEKNLRLPVCIEVYEIGITKLDNERHSRKPSQKSKKWYGDRKATIGDIYHRVNLG